MHDASHPGAGRFVNQLRVRPAVLRVGSPDTSTTWTVRVQAADAWDAVRVACTPDSTVREVKLVAMATLLPDVPEPEACVVKLHGAEVANEAMTLTAAGARDASTLCLLFRRRRPLR